MKNPAVPGPPTAADAEEGAGELHRSEEALRRSEQRYRALVEATSQAVWSWSPHGEASDFSRAHRWWERLTGQTAAEQRANPSAWLEVVHPADREATAAAWDNAMASGRLYDVEFRGTRGRVVGGMFMRGVSRFPGLASRCASGSARWTT
jgi:PAS domain S-box-containing protein